ncbi:uncharacterized protein PG998_004274 [Apiospora kogelbergensis]|uniref:uncharacterized protein n=1 Tax=Apiospora kogelbergensis TaxID=1337665 RepID=UPI00312F3E36
MERERKRVPFAVRFVAGLWHLIVLWNQPWAQISRYHWFMTKRTFHAWLVFQGLIIGLLLFAGSLKVDYINARELSVITSATGDRYHFSHELDIGFVLICWLWWFYYLVSSFYHHKSSKLSLCVAVFIVAAIAVPPVGALIAAPVVELGGETRQATVWASFKASAIYLRDRINNRDNDEEDLDFYEEWEY